jgi:hypothetical protein
MAATYDGIAFSCLVWLVVVIVEPPVAGASGGRFVLPILAGAAAALSFWQGNSYLKSQVREVIAVLASGTQRLIP